MESKLVKEEFAAAKPTFTVLTNFNIFRAEGKLLHLSWSPIKSSNLLISLDFKGNEKLKFEGRNIVLRWFFYKSIVPNQSLLFLAISTSS